MAYGCLLKRNVSWTERAECSSRETVPTTQLPESKKSSELSTTQIIAVIGGAVGLLILSGSVAMWAMFSFVQSSSFGKTADNMFGDQHLKTVVALVELHRVRTGEYPGSLENLKFTGSWDQGAIHSVTYCRNENGQSYYVEVRRGWVGKPELDFGDEFWVGTGYDPKLAPCH